MRPNRRTDMGRNPKRIFLETDGNILIELKDFTNGRKEFEGK